MVFLSHSFAHLISIAPPSASPLPKLPAPQNKSRPRNFGTSIGIKTLAEGHGSVLHGDVREPAAPIGNLLMRDEEKYANTLAAVGFPYFVFGPNHLDIAAAEYSLIVYLTELVAVDKLVARMIQGSRADLSPP